MLHGGIPHTLLLFHTYGQALLYKITLVSNFIPGELYNVNGPWWFLSLIVQFYLLFPLLLWSEKRYGSKVLVLIALGALIMIAMLQPYVDISLTGTVLAHLPELCLGIYFATQKKVSMHYGVIALVALVFILSSFYPFFWYFSFSSVLLLMLVVGQLLFMKVNDWFKSKMLFLGTISMYIFYINGFMRSPWIENANAYKSWYVSLLLSLLFVVLVVAVAYVMWRVSSYLLRVKRN
jgi:peptidoglycan/LPS O-acetylase OafA/YrhL